MPAIRSRRPGRDFTRAAKALYYRTRGRRKRRARARPRRGPRTWAFSGENGKGFRINFKSRKIGPRAWRRVLWRDTLAESHYRSTFCFVISNAFSESTTLGSGVVNVCPAITINQNPFHAVGTEFWTGAGGAAGINANVTPPQFLGDIVLRGGIIRFTLANPDTGIPQLLKVWLVRVFRNPSVQVYSQLNQQLKNLEYDPSVEAEFSTKFGRIVFKREILMNPGRIPFTVVHRLQVQKIDQDVWRGKDTLLDDELAGNQYYWIWQLVPLFTNPTSDVTQTFISYNLSFSGDETNFT